MKEKDLNIIRRLKKSAIIDERYEDASDLRELEKVVRLSLEKHYIDTRILTMEELAL